MARPITINPLFPATRLPSSPELVPQRLTFFRPPKGVNRLSPRTAVPREYADTIANLALDRGKHRSRMAVETFGSAASDPVMHTADFLVSTGLVVPVRVTTTSFQYHDGADWVTVPGDAITGDVFDFFTFAAWNDRLLFDNGVSGLHEYNPATNALRVIAAAPKAQHLTTFGGRVVASSVSDPDYRPYRIRWCVKNDHEDWTGLGSGFEDLLSTPGGQIDAVMGVYPISDDTAIVVRTNSIWLMTVTGFFDAPFRFTGPIFSKVGTDARHTIHVTPAGVIFFGRDDVYVVNRGGFQRIGEPVLEELLHTSELGRREFWGAYLTHHDKYFLAVKEGGSYLNRVWEYSFPDQGWTKHTYPFDIRTIAPTRYLVSTTFIDDLVGNIDDLVGVIDDLGVTDIVDGLYLTMAGTGRHTTRENPARTQDVNNAGTNADSPIEIRTGVVHADDPLHEVELIEAQLEYEAEDAQTLIFEYSTDGGNTWLSYSSIAITATTRPEVLSVRRTLATSSLMVRVRSTTLGGLTLIALHLFATKGAMIRP